MRLRKRRRSRGGGEGLGAGLRRCRHEASGAQHQLGAVVTGATFRARCTMEDPAGAEAPPPHGDDATDEILDADDEAEHAPFEGRVFVDLSIDGRWWVTDTTTQESKQLPGQGPWGVVIHPETGRAVLYSEDETIEAFAVDSFMTKHLFVHPGSDELVLASIGVDGQPNHQFLSSLRIRVREGLLKLKVGTVAAEVALNLFCFRLQRGAGSRYYFSAMSLYETLDLDQYKKQATKWFYNQHKSWSRRLRVFFGSGDIVHSTAHENDEVQFHDKCLHRLVRETSPQLRRHRSPLSGVFGSGWAMPASVLASGSPGRGCE